MDSSKPLLSSPSPLTITPPPPTIPKGFFIRAVTIVLLLAVSLWANYEASKGFDLTIPNPPTTTIAGRKFDLMFVSNGKAARMLLEASNAIEHILYPNPNPNPSHTMHFTKKLVRHVVLELAGGEEEESTEVVEVTPGEYLILIKQEILEQENVTEAMEEVLYRAMAHVWVWGGTDLNKSNIVDGIVECLMEKSGFGSASVGEFVRKCEERSEGFVARLNYAVHEMRSERVVDKALDRMIQELCLEHLQLASF